MTVTFEAPNWTKIVPGEALLKFKGAKAGEIAGRLTETVPEDFLAI